MRVLVLYDSKTGNTEKMALAIAEGIRDTGYEVDVKKLGEPFTPSIIWSYNGVAFGSPAIYANASREIRDFLQELKEAQGSRKTARSQKAGIFGSYGYDGALILESKMREFALSIGFVVFPEACMKVDFEIRTRTGDTMAFCRAWGKRFAEFLPF